MTMQEMAWYTLNVLNARSIYNKGRAALRRLPKPKRGSQTLPLLLCSRNNSEISIFALHEQYSLLGLCIPRANGHIPTPDLNKNIKVLTGN